MRHVDEITIHCTATRPNWWKSRSSAQKVAEVKRWHVEENGWRDIGYHFLIDRNGKVIVGRPIEQTGAHVKGHNRGKIGICLFGGHGGTERDKFEDNFTDDQEVALLNLIAGLKKKYGNMNVSGHNQYAAKACPCFDAPMWYNEHAVKPLTKPRKSDKVKDEFSLWGFIADVLLNWRRK